MGLIPFRFIQSSQRFFRGLIFGALLILSQHSVGDNIKNNQQENKSEQRIILTQFEREIAQRLMISIRYFCLDSQQKDIQNPVNLAAQCSTPVKKLPTALAQLIADTDLGGVVLFSENIASHKQVLQLTHDLQLASQKSMSKKPLFIAIDQEGGRVVRLNRKNSTAFSGNMAIGATYPEQGIHYARQVGKIIGQELNALGINLDFSPNVDVNSNPDNPVINVRSFGQDPKVVAKLGVAMMDSLQQQNIIATLKHFPGHGNTSIDSHTGLPLVDDNEAVISTIDLVPFQTAIKQSNPGMIMTAHIQYPALDPSTVETQSGEAILKPATMSKEILTQLLRDKMGFKGVVITDALNMAGISDNFSAEQATAMSLMAGADIALMPFRIRTLADTEQFKLFIKKVADILLKQSSAQNDMQQSIARIDRLKNEYSLTQEKYSDSLIQPFTKKLRQAERVLAQFSSRVKQKHLAIESITLLKNDPLDEQQVVIPLSKKNELKLHIIVQDTRQLAVVKRALEKYWPQKNTSKLTLSFSLIERSAVDIISPSIEKADAIIAFYSARRESAVVKGEVDDLVSETDSLQSESKRLMGLLASLTFAQSIGKKVIVAGMYSPFDMRQFLPVSDTILVAYDASIYRHPESKVLIGVTYDAVIAAIFGVNKITGKLPVSM